MRKPFDLDWAEVSISCGASHSGRRKARFSRALSVSSSNWTFTHVPTGVTVSGRVIPGHYSRGELDILNERLRRVLFGRLEYEVSKHIRAPGRKALTASDDHELFEIVVGKLSRHGG